MGSARDIICTVCPKGCAARGWEEEGQIRVKGEGCKKGKPYIEQEYRDPRRILTTTVLTESHRFRRLPVRTSAPIPKGDLFKTMARLSEVRVSPPVKIGQVILADISRGVDLIASDDLLE
jgi:CxxC motif-containing protein